METTSLKLLLCCLTLPITLCSCTYLQYASVQAEYARIQKAEPGQLNLKHMLDHENYFVIGKTVDEDGLYSEFYLAVAAYSNRYKENERVDTMYFAGAGTHYGLNLPEGEYTLLVFADQNQNNTFDKWEVVGKRTIQLNEKVAPEKGLIHIDLELGERQSPDWVQSIPMPEVTTPQKSLFFPVGTIRDLSDAIFDDNMTTLGMYDPAAFNEKVPTMFYALEEDLGYKIPVIFVHGIEGSPRNFQHILDKLDRKRYKPWFFFYPSGGDLEQLGSVFYKIFISGEIAHIAPMPVIIVAHSMGGLVVREALNHYGASIDENKISLFISIATPFGGHPAAATGEKHGLIVLPSWRDVNPDSEFISKLFRQPLPGSLDHQLIYAFQNPDVLKLNENSDGVVPLSSQLYPVAQKQSKKQFGFNSSHTSILENEDMIAYILERMQKVKNYFPEEHLQILFEGGYDVEPGEDYSPLVTYFIENYGKYVMALTNGSLKPIDDDQKNFLEIAKGVAPARNEIEKGWLKFTKSFPTTR